MPINLLLIENFKSIKNLRLGCKRINLFIGEPNTGKSNILEAIGVLSHICHGSIEEFVRFENMTDLFYDHILEDPIAIGFDDARLELSFKDGWFRGISYSPSFSRNRAIQTFMYGYDGNGSRSSMEEYRRFRFFRFAKLSSFENQKSEYLQPPKGDNLLAVIQSDKVLRDIAKGIFEKFGYRLVLRPHEKKIEIQKELEDIIISLPYSLASETLLRLVFYVSAMHSTKNSIIAIEEPEAHAFPYYTKYLAERIAGIENNNQYFIATHNPYFLTTILEKTPKEEIEIFVTRLKNYQTIVQPLNQEQKEAVLADMGYDVFFDIERFLA